MSIFSWNPNSPARGMERTLPLCIVIDDVDEMPWRSRLPYGRRTIEELLTASVLDLLMRSAIFPELQAQVYCAYPWESLKQVTAPLVRGRMSDIIAHSGKGEALCGLAIAADAPTVPSGYLRAAIDSVLDHACAWVHGESAAGDWYLFGWGDGCGKTSVPTWTRLLEPEGLAHLQRDVARGSTAPKTAGLLRHLLTYGTNEASRIRQRVGAGRRTTPLLLRSMS
jgi:hypothetical protein